MDKIFSILKSKCNTRQQRLAFNQLIKSFVEYQSLDDLWDSIFKNGEFKGNTKAKGGTVQGKHMSIYIKFKGDKGAYQVVDNSNGTTVSQGKVDRNGKKEPIKSEITDNKQDSKSNEEPKETSDAVSKIDASKVKSPDWVKNGRNGIKLNELGHDMYLQSEELKDEDPDAAEQLLNESGALAMMHAYILRELGPYVIWEPEIDDIPSDLQDKLYKISNGEIKENVNNIGTQYWMDGGRRGTNWRDDNTTDGGYKIINIGGVKIAEISSSADPGSSALTSWAVPKEHAKKLYKYLESLK